MTAVGSFTLSWILASLSLRALLTLAGAKISDADAAGMESTCRRISVRAILSGRLCMKQAVATQALEVTLRVAPGRGGSSEADVHMALYLCQPGLGDGRRPPREAAADGPGMPVLELASESFTVPSPRGMIHSVRLGYDGAGHTLEASFGVDSDGPAFAVELDLGAAISLDLGCAYVGLCQLPLGHRHRVVAGPSAGTPVAQAPRREALDQPVSIVSWRHSMDALRTAADAASAPAQGGARRRAQDNKELVMRDAWFSAMELSYDAPWPLPLVITQASMERYNRLFKLLLAFRHVQLELLRASLPRGELLPWAMRSELSFFVSQVLVYFQQDVIEASFAKLMHSVEASREFGEVLEAHEGFLATLSAQCFLTAQEIHDALMTALQIAALFCWRMGEDRGWSSHRRAAAAAWPLAGMGRQGRRGRPARGGRGGADADGEKAAAGVASAKAPPPSKAAPGRGEAAAAPDAPAKEARLSKAAVAQQLEAHSDAGPRGSAACSEEASVEDDGFMIRKLLITFDDIDLRVRRPRARRGAQELPPDTPGTPPDPSGTPAEKLVRCLRKVIQTTSSRRIQYKLQDLMLDWLHMPAPSADGGPPPDVYAWARARQDFWKAYHVDATKWEGASLGPGRAAAGPQAVSGGAGRCELGIVGPELSRHATLGALGRPLSAAAAEATLRHGPRPVQTLEELFESTAPGDERQRGSSSGGSSCAGGPSEPQGREARSTSSLRAPDAGARPPVLPDLSRAASMPGLVHLDELAEGRGRSCVWAVTEAARLCAGAPSKSSTAGAGRGASSASRAPRRPVRGESFPRAHQVQDSGALVQSDTWKYFQECRRLKMVPRMPAMFLGPEAAICTSPSGDANLTLSEIRTPGGRRKLNKLTFESSVPTISISGEMSDRDLLALCEPLGGHEPRLANLDLSRNAFTDAGVAKFLEHMQEWMTLEVLELAGCVLSESTWASFCTALHVHDRLVELDVSETGLGRVSQRSVQQIALFAMDARRLRRLCISRGNCIFQEGFEALAETVRRTATIGHLDVSHNAMTHLVSSSSCPGASASEAPPRPASGGGGRAASKGRAPPAAAGRSAAAGPGFNPMALLCEALSQNQSLVELCMASSSLDYAVDVVLLTALQPNKTLQYVDISGNPHGGQGLKALLRVLMDPDSSLVSCIAGSASGCAETAPSGTFSTRAAARLFGWHAEASWDHREGRPVRDTKPHRCIVTDFRECSPGPDAVVVNFAAPNGRYELDLGHPQHRAVARWLLSEAAVNDPRGDPAGAFSHVSCDFPTAVKAQFGEGWYAEGSEGHWEVPTRGKLKLSFALDLQLAAHKTAVGAVRRWMTSRRIPVTLSRFVLLHELFFGLSLEQKALLIQSMGETLLLKTCHLQKLLKTCPMLHDVMVRSLYPTLVDTRQLLLFELMSKQKTVAARFRKEARALFFFQDSSPTGVYQLSLDQLTDRFVAERLQIINAYEKAIAIGGKMVDTSQHGNHEGARNVTWLWQPLKSLQLFQVPANPMAGSLNLDYASPPHSAPRLADPATADAVVTQLIAAMTASECSPEDKIMAFRTVSQHMVFTVVQVSRLCRALPNPRRPEGMGDVAWRMTRSLKNRRTAMTSAFQYKFWNCSADMFVAIFNRCHDQPRLCTPECLYDRSLFTPACTQHIRERLGVFRTFDALQCCGQRVAPAEGGRSASITGARFLARLYAAQSKERPPRSQEGPAAEGVQPSGRSRTPSKSPPSEDDDPCQTISAQEIGMKYRLDLSVFEEWTTLRFLILLTEKEPGTHFLKCTWSERAFLREQGFDFMIPPSWSAPPGRVGVIEFHYITEKRDFRRLDARGDLAQELFGWERSAAAAAVERAKA
ncbi:unnamed protein product [Prorocentrum cordatum]|uniref:Gamma tubulin complex component C-terminal domain-containing protein n=1 Tax=Prorocentrum cordatum TaxID=2364126 RepID=A0ABN9TTY8_9DINO|nr:unnamed protein product [Polarella glacialis]